MKSISINGASGWLGTATLRAISRIEGDKAPWAKTLFGSYSRNHTFVGLGEYEIQKYPMALAEKSGTDIFVNLAFKTRDYIKKFGETEYARENLEIIKNSILSARISNPKSIVLISSGVVTKYQQTGGKYHDDAYTRLKIYEEECFKQLSDELDANLIILRMWAATGEDMTEPQKYGIGNLLIQSQLENAILIESSRKVFRKYADASQQLEICLRAALDGKSMTVNSGGALIEIRDLAERIRVKYSPKLLVKQHWKQEEVADDYFWSGDEFESMARRFKVELYSLDEQIELTFKSVTRYLEHRNLSTK
jgi:nucleoside-diphosphate-sugar epimerase